MGADFAAGTPADVLLINYRNFASLAAKGVFAPLGPFLAKSAVIQETDFYPEAINPFYWKDQLVCLPQNISSLVVYYNKNLFDQAGLAYPKDDWNWDDFLKTAQALTKDLDGDGVNDQHGLGTEASLIRLAPFVWQNGGSLLNDPDHPNRLALDEPAGKEAFQWFVNLQTKYHVVPNQQEESAENSESRFQNGRLGMFLNSRKGVPTYRTITSFDWDVTGLPRKLDPASILHTDAYCMPASVKNKDLVWKFIEFANSIEGQTIISLTGRTVPSLRSVAESPAFLDPNARPKNSRVFVDTIAYILPVPLLPNWTDIESIVSEEIARAYYGNATIDEAIQTATERTLIYLKTE
jgi:multiple sugar transport system substrate-binding protein